MCKGLKRIFVADPKLWETTNFWPKLIYLCLQSVYSFVTGLGMKANLKDYSYNCFDIKANIQNLSVPFK